MRLKMSAKEDGMIRSLQRLKRTASERLQRKDESQLLGLSPLRRALNKALREPPSLQQYERSDKAEIEN